MKLLDHGFIAVGLFVKINGIIQPAITGKLLGPLFTLLHPNSVKIKGIHIFCLDLIVLVR
jgi:hypothetical protein